MVHSRIINLNILGAACLHGCKGQSMESLRYCIFPFANIRSQSRVILYGAGDVGQTFFHQVQKTGYCTISGWIDQRWNDVSDLPHPFIPLSDILELEFDYIVIAISDPSISQGIAQEFRDKGVPAEKIVLSEACQLEYNTCHPSDVQSESGTSEGLAFVRVLAGAAGLSLKSNHAAQLPKHISSKSQRIWNLAIVGTGFMAEIIVTTVQRRFSNVRVHAVLSRHMVQGEAFAQRFGIPRAYDSKEALAHDPDVDLVHIATPVFLHHEQCIFFLRHGKHVLCEKPFALNEAQAQDMISTAQNEGLLLAHGVWPRYMPMAKKLREILDSGRIGKICTLTGNLYYLAADSNRLTTRSMGGGITLENGTYLMALASLVLGTDVRSIHAAGLLHENGVDRQSSVTLVYEDALAVFTCGMDAVSDRRAHIYGDNGFITIDNANEYKIISVHDSQGNLVEKHNMQSGYEHEIRACIESLEHGFTATPQYTHEETIFAFRMMDEVRKQLHVSYDADFQ